MMKYEIINQLDIIESEDQSCDTIFDEMSSYYHKQTQLLNFYVFEYASLVQETNDTTFSSKILSTISNIFKFISKIISNIVNWFSKIFQSKQKKTPNQVLEETLNTNQLSTNTDDGMKTVVEYAYYQEQELNETNSNDTIHINVNKDSEVTPEDIRLYSTDVILSFKDQNTFTIKLSVKNDNSEVIESNDSNIINNSNNSNNSNNDNSENTSIISQTRTINSPLASLLLMTTPQLTDAFNVCANAFNALINDSISNSSTINVGVQNKIGTYLSTFCTLLDQTHYDYTNKYDKHVVAFDVSMNQLRTFQKMVNDNFKKIDKFIASTNNFTKVIDKNVLSALTKFLNKMNMIQMSFNGITGALKSYNIIDRKYFGKINAIGLLDGFINGMINNGVPSKFIGYNAWLVCDKAIRGGEDNFEPKWGQTRIVFFPTNKTDRVYKIALNTMGIEANRAECVVTTILNEAKRTSDYSTSEGVIAPVRQISKASTIISQMKAVGQKPTNDECFQLTRELNAAIRKYEKRKFTKTGIIITDLHSANVCKDEQGRLVAFDYGMSNKVFI